MRCVVLLALIALFAAPVRAEPVLARDAETRWIAFERTTGNQIRFTMRINGRPANALLDTGVSFTVASKRFAAGAGLKPASGARAQAIGGTVTVAWAAVETLEFGGLSRKGGRIAVTDFAGLPTGGASPIDLLVGADLLHHVALDIDYDEGRFRLLPSGRMPFGGISVPLSLARDSGIYLSELTIGARRVRPVIVDTGDGSSATVTSTSWNATRPEGARVTTTLSYGLGGQVVADLTILPQLRIGALPVRNVELRIERDAGFAQATGSAGRIGSGLLERYRVLMDPRAGRMILRPGKRIDARPVKSTSGILAGFQSGELAVLHIMRGSPAAAAGWQVGERICRIDGQLLPADYLASPLAGWAIGTPGRTVTLELCGGDKRQLTLADFY